MDRVQKHGFSIAGIHNLNPSPGDYNAAGLIEIKEQVTPYMLDPNLEVFEYMYSIGNSSAMGFYPTQELITQRQNAIAKQHNHEGTKASQQSERAGSNKRPQRDSSASSAASNSYDRKGWQSSSQTGGRLSYEKNHQELLSHENDGKKIRGVLENRLKSSGLSVTGTVIKNDSEPLAIFTTLAQRGNSEVKCTRLHNPKGTPATTMVYSKSLEDSAVKPNEFSTYCEQCHEHHLVHNMEPQKIVFVTENGELANGARSHSGALEDPSFKNLLLKAGITPCQIIHIEFVDVRDGGVYADNLTWLTALIERECMCRCFVFWNVGTSFLLSGGSVDELLAKNALVESYVANMEVKIRHTKVDLRHQFVYVPLVFTRDTMDLDFQEMNKEEQVKGNLPVAGNSFNNFLDYNSRVSDLVMQIFPNSDGYLDDPNLLLAVECVKTSTQVFGETYDSVKYQFRKGNHPGNTRLMTDSTRQGYFVNLVRWVKDTFAQETKDEMARKGVPHVSANLRLAKRYTRNTQIA